LHAISALGKICTPSAINSNPSLTDYEVYFLKSSTANIKSLREVVVSPTQAAKSSALIPLALANPSSTPVNISIAIDLSSSISIGAPINN